ncbi:hypothetical protein R5R35_002084 [Gryllus longicercus]|uniref:Carbonic anhydrase n=1 Tax=Gryllus longicercus TaxID=2509291 RepID=A0AAN9Z2M5_9ORTH
MAKGSQMLLLLATLLGAPGVLCGLHYGHQLASPTSWFNVWFSTPGEGQAGSAGPLGPPRRQRPGSPSRQIAPSFGYSAFNGPDTWTLEWPECAGGRQSPIDLRSDDMLRLRTTSPLRWDGYWRPVNMSMTNTGHTVEVSGDWGSAGTPTLSGGPLEGEYVFSDLHFHWGPDDAVGSEHTVHNVSFPMEMHAVHYKRDYGNKDNAREFDDGLVVVSYLFRRRNTANGALEPLLRAMHDVSGARGLPPAPLRPQPFALSRLLREFEEDYVMYEGSLTTPPCREAVTWLISARPLPVSAQQLEEFRSLIGEDGEVDRNFRPVQPSNGRSVYYVDVE